MDPHIYLTYLCLLDNNSNINRTFKGWVKNVDRYSFSWAIKDIRLQMIRKARYTFFYEGEKAWFDVFGSRFILFLNKYGFRK
jgi:hypothetical protein